VILGSLVTGIFGADSLNALSTNVWFNLIFFGLLVFFAASFLGAFEIVLPNSWANKVDQQADRGGFVGILFMALALAIVSFSCTGPIVGTLLVEAASKGGLAPIIGMLGFSSALALPFMLFAMFPGWMNSLPKSGGWLNTVKVSLGFLELALAFKFLSNADLVVQAHLLEREVFLAIWIAIFGTWAVYLFGKLT
jgi:thiol:disulfide interchange protein DsbD